MRTIAYLLYTYFAWFYIIHFVTIYICIFAFCKFVCVWVIMYVSYWWSDYRIWCWDLMLKLWIGWDGELGSMRIEDILFFDFTVSYAEKYFFFCLICVYLFWIWIKIICNRMIWCLKFLLNHQSSNCSVLFLERKKCFRHANRWKRVSFPLSLFLSCDNHFPYTCIEFNYKNISGKKGAESKLYSKLKLH